MALALLVGVAGGAVLLSAAGARRTNSSYARYLRASRASDLLVAPGLPGYDAALARLPDVATIVHAAILNPVDNQGRPAAFAVIGAGAGYADAVDRPKVMSGRMFRTDDPAEAVVDVRMASQSHLRPGSALDLSLTPQNPGGRGGTVHLALHVVGVVATRNDAVAVSTNDAFPQVLVTPALLRGLDAHYGLDYVLVRLRPGSSPTAVAQVARSVAQRFPAIAHEIDIANESDQAARIEQAIRPQAAALAIFAFLAALAALVVVGQVATRELLASSLEHSALRAIGTTRAQLFAIMLLRIAIAALLGAGIAISLAIVASPLVLFGPARISEPHPGIAADWTVLGAGAVCIVVLLVLRVAWSAWRLTTATPYATRSGPRAGRVRTSRVAREAAQLGAPVTVAMGVRLALEPGRGRTAVPVRSALAGGVIAVAAVAAAVTFGSNLVHLVQTPRLYGQTWDVAIDAQFASPPTPVYVHLIAKHPGVDRWSFGDYAAL
ncbi:MAG: putative transport system permease protein, partial [Actinomycetota bacterium]|nr:putative transport system permease protein [Actinomycetota bacterium]